MPVGLIIKNTGLDRLQITYSISGEKHEKSLKVWHISHSIAILLHDLDIIKARKLTQMNW